ncbi:MAG: MarR family winged helix-turn-helix transcriptional regulator [Polymorphobacter sp.]|jgi:MarR family transcriptional regulator for hemolysin
MVKDERTFGIQVTLVARLLRTRFDKRARTVALTRPQWRTIVAVRYNEGSTQRELAGILEVASVTVGRIIDKLEHAGLIERRADAIDRRAYRLYLTEQSGLLFDRLAELGAEEQRYALAGLSGDERQQLSDLLDRIIANLATDDGG